MNKRGYSAFTPETQVLIRFMKSFSSAQNSFSSPEPLAKPKETTGSVDENDERLCWRGATFGFCLLKKTSFLWRGLSACSLEKCSCFVTGCIREHEEVSGSGFILFWALQIRWLSMTISMTSSSFTWPYVKLSLSKIFQNFPCFSIFSP